MKNKTRTLAVGGLLAALMIVMRVLGIDIIPIPPAGVAVSHIPVVLGTILGGLPVGMFLSLIFGGVSLYQAYTTPMALAPAFMNPLVSILPRLLIPVAVWAVSKLIRYKNDGNVWRVGVLAVLGSLANTVFVLTALGLLYSDLLVTGLGISPNAVFAFLGGIALTNGLPEAAACALICIPVVKALARVYKPRGDEQIPDETPEQEQP